MLGSKFGAKNIGVFHRNGGERKQLEQWVITKWIGNAITIIRITACPRVLTPGNRWVLQRM